MNLFPPTNTSSPAQVNAALLEKEPGAPLFPAAIGKTGKLSRRPLVRTDAADMLKRRLKQAGLPAHYSPHSFRANGITNFLENDGTLEAAQRSTWTRWLAPRFQHVHAIEPNPDALPILCANLPCNVTVHELGAWNHETILTFTQFANSAHLSSFFKEEGINTGPKVGTVELRCCAIDSLRINQPVDFLKCDTEGAEIECLLGAEQLILRDEPWLLVENHSAGNFISLVRLLANWDYLFTIIRHPDYEPYSRFWFEHCWFSCQPSPEKRAWSSEG